MEIINPTKIDKKNFLQVMMENIKGVNAQGVFQAPARELGIYVTFLSNIVVNMYQWRNSNLEGAIMSQDELDMIEPLLLTRGFCALIKPKVKVGKLLITLEQPKVFEVNPTRWIRRGNVPTAVNIVNIGEVHGEIPRHMTLLPQYEQGEFSIITDFYDMRQTHTPKFRTVIDYAQRLQEIDYAVHANLQKLKMPIIGRVEDEAAINNMKVIIEGISNNAIAAYIDNKTVGHHMDIFTNFEIPYHIKQLLEDKTKLIEDFARNLGINIVDNAQGTYQARDVQLEGLSFNAYKRQIGFNARNKGVRHAMLTHGLQLELSYFRENVIGGDMVTDPA